MKETLFFLRTVLGSFLQNFGFHGCIQNIAPEIVKNIEGKTRWVVFESNMRDIFKAVICYPESDHCELRANPFINLRTPEAKIPFLVGIEEERVVVVNDPLTSEYTEYMYDLVRRERITAIVFVPFLNKRKALSFLVIDKVAGGQFSEQEREFLQSCSDMVSGFMPSILQQPLVKVA